MEEQAILRYRASNGGTFKQARAAVVVNVAKEIRPKLFTQVVRGTSTRAVTTSATVKESDARNYPLLIKEYAQDEKRNLCFIDTKRCKKSTLNAFRNVYKMRKEIFDLQEKETPRCQKSFLIGTTKKEGPLAQEPRLFSNLLGDNN
ncbi:hypothetical protein ElyMa_001216200 [Elysia marginata]|uniref:Uncharacterized protein n=1 Tax=Elysia marginata TaxID=1093978 RepID=A0AAV4I840_9GAST|nr:hypothetical protein ElyMa_001216200 [Elysia marginata]